VNFLLVYSMKHENLNKLIQEAVTLCQVELYHYEWIMGGRQNILRIFIDKPGGVTVLDCEKVSRELSVLLDVEDPIPQHYTLEVSSPGLDRKLYNVKHYKDHLQMEVDVKVKPGDGKIKHRWNGVLTAVEENGFFIECDGDSHHFHFSDVEWTSLKIII